MMIPLPFISYLKYLWKAKDPHSVHSPFVFKLLCLCIHKVSKASVLEVYLSAVQNYLKDFSVAVSVLEGADRECSKNTFTNPNDHCFFILDIHKNKLSEQCWSSLIQDKNIQISIDFWSFGLIFIKKNQEKEHFILFKSPWR
jgi:hypothetical protein